MISLKKIGSSGESGSFKLMDSNVFGYSPYDKGTVTNDFAAMLDGMKKKTSIMKFLKNSKQNLTKAKKPSKSVKSNNEN
jgi:hypothetical protein